MGLGDCLQAVPGIWMPLKDEVVLPVPQRGPSAPLPHQWRTLMWLRGTEEGQVWINSPLPICSWQCLLWEVITSWEEDFRLMARRIETKEVGVRGTIPKFTLHFQARNKTLIHKSGSHLFSGEVHVARLLSLSGGFQIRGLDFHVPGDVSH